MRSIELGSTCHQFRIELKGKTHHQNQEKLLISSCFSCKYQQDMLFLHAILRYFPFQYLIPTITNHLVLTTSLRINQCRKCWTLQWNKPVIAVLKFSWQIQQEASPIKFFMSLSKTHPKHKLQIKLYP
jgi:hypothetical protein